MALITESYPLMALIKSYCVSWMVPSAAAGGAAWVPGPCPVPGWVGTTQPGWSHSCRCSAGGSEAELCAVPWAHAAALSLGWCPAVAVWAGAAVICRRGAEARSGARVTRGFISTPDNSS